MNADGGCRVLARRIETMWRTGYYGYLSDYLGWWLLFGSLALHTWCFFRFFPNDRAPRFRLVVGNALIAACMLSFAGNIAETYLRFLNFETDSYGATLTAHRWFKIYPKLNSLYHRDVEWTQEKPPGVTRIAFVGDSFTYGWGIKDAEDRFTNIIQRRFDRRGRGEVEVMNVAWGGWDTRDHAKAIVEMIATYNVDEVVLCYLPNDIAQIIPVTEDFDPAHPPRSTYLRTDSSFLLDYLYYRVYTPRWQPSVAGYFDWLADAFDDPELWRKHQEDLGLIIQHCRERDVTLRIVILPLIRTRGGYDGRKIHSQLRAFFELNNVPVVDLLDTIRGRDALVVSAHDPHPNEFANQLFADAVWKVFFAEKAP